MTLPQFYSNSKEKLNSSSLKLFLTLLEAKRRPSKEERDSKGPPPAIFLKAFTVLALLGAVCFVLSLGQVTGMLIYGIVTLFLLWVIRWVRHEGKRTPKV
jgi:protein-S-isoprenylcysteine O-methyltransferase Ste14